MSSSPVGLPSPERVPMTREDVSRLSDEELLALAEIVSEESKKRERESARFAKGLRARAMKRDPRCPKCAAKLWRDGKRKDGVQTYVCPKCGKKSCDASGTWPGSRIWGNECDVELRQADQ